MAKKDNPMTMKIFHSKVFENFVSLGMIQGINYVLPLITIPFLFNQLGVENYGLVNFSFAFIQYFIILTDFGFGLSGTRYIAAHSENKEAINRFLCSACLSRIGMASLSFIILLVCLWIIPSFQQHKFFTLLFFGQVIGNCLNPVWFFQGMQQMRFNTILHIITRCVSILPLFVIVRRPDDYLYIPICYSGGYIVSGILCLWFIRKHFGMRFFITTYQEIKQVTIDSSRYFFSRVSVSLYTNTNSFILGLVCGNTAVGYYSIAEKIYIALNSIYGPINGAIFPYMTEKKNLSMFKKILSIGTIGNAFFILLFYISFPYIYPLFFENFASQSWVVLCIFLLSNILCLPATFLGYPFLAAWGHPNYCNYSLIFTSLFHIAGLLILYSVDSISIYSVAYMVTLCEGVLLAIRIFGTIKYKLWIK